MTGNLWGDAVQARDIHGDVTLHGHRWWITALASVVAATVVGYWATRPEEGTPRAAPPELVSSVRYHGCGLQHLEGDPTNADVERLKKGDDPTIVHTTSSLLKLDVYAQNPSPQEVLLTGLRIDVHRRVPPPASGFFGDSGPCGGPVDPRHFMVDLRDSPPTVTPKPGERGERAIDFPYQVSRQSPELLRLQFERLDHYVEFAVVLEVIVNGRTHEVRLDNEGRYFKVTGLSELPQFQLDDARTSLVPTR